MKLIKTSLRNKIEKKFISECIVIYIKREFVNTINLNSIIDEFNYQKYRKTQLK